MTLVFKLSSTRTEIQCSPEDKSLFSQVESLSGTAHLFNDNVGLVSLFLARLRAPRGKKTAINTRLQYKIGLRSELTTLQYKRSPRQKMNYRLQLQVWSRRKNYYEFQCKIGPLRELPGGGLHSGEVKARSDERFFSLLTRRARSTCSHVVDYHQVDH